MVAAPWPLVDDRAIHDASVCADQEHSRSDVIVSLAVPPDAGSSDALFEMATWHLEAVGPVTLVVVDDPHAANANEAHASARAANHRRRKGTPATYVVHIGGRVAERRRHRLRKSATFMQYAGRR